MQHCAVPPYVVQKPPIGWQDDCAAIGRWAKLRPPTVSITITAKFLKIRKRDMDFLLLAVCLLSLVVVLGH